ncbi:MAG: hypothetical protein ABSC64_02135 [Candidatus Korobacteraceae bacterium]
MPTKNQLIKLIEKKEKKEQELRELDARINKLADDLGMVMLILTGFRGARTNITRAMKEILDTAKDAEIAVEVLTDNSEVNVYTLTGNTLELIANMSQLTPKTFKEITSVAVDVFGPSI